MKHDFSLEYWTGKKGAILDVRVTKGYARYGRFKTMRTWLYHRFPWLPMWITGWVRYNFSPPTVPFPHGPENTPKNPIPVEERLPQREDCDKEDRCWWWRTDEVEEWWELLCLFNANEYNKGCGTARYTHWLPHYAIPYPQ